MAGGKGKDVVDGERGGKGSGKTNVIATAVILLLVAAGVGAWLGFGALGSGSGANVVVVHDADGNELRFSLDQDARQTITTSLGSNTVVVEGGSVHVEEADCSNHDCMKQGMINTPGQQIICLPHKLWIEVLTADGSSVGNAPSELSDDDSSSAGSDGNDSFDAESR